MQAPSHQGHEHAACCAHAQHEHENACRSHEHAHGECCGHAHAAPQDIDAAALGEASATRAIYRIANMDCPMEEALIRKKLAAVPGITGLHFRLMQRVLIVDHELPSTETIEAALKAIDMEPESLAGEKGAVAVFSVNGMDCPVEERLIRSKLAGMPGVFALDFNLMQRTLQVRHEPSALPAISAALAALNMDARLLDTQSGAGNVIAAPKIPWKKLAIAGIFAALSEGAELVHEWGAKPFGLDMSAWTLGSYPVLEYLPLLFAVIAIALGGLTTYKKGWLAVSNFNLNINALMSVAVTGAVLIGQFPEAAMVMVLFNLSEAIEAKALDRARNAIKDLLALAPDTATVAQEDGTWREMDIREVAVGSRVRVKPGEKIALDGLVVNGMSMVNQAPITGESMPVEKKAGNPVYAGTINESGSFEFEVTAAATDSTLARIIHAVEEAQGSRAPMQRFVDAFAKYYTPVVFLISILAAVIPPLLLGGAWLDSIYTALVVLVIGCPCALVISTPVSIVSGMAAATRYGILIKGGMFLEQGRLLTCLALDKTGTITHGKPRQTDFVRIGKEDESRIISLAASLAARSDHPVSRAVAQAAAESGIRLQPVEAFAAIPGQGVSGVIDGQKWFMGNHRMVEELKQCSNELEQQIFKLEKQGKTVVALMSEAGVQCLLAVADTVKNSSIEALRELKKLGVKTVMLTGDNEHTAEVIARQVGVDDFKASLLPQDKLAVVAQLEQNGEKVGMVGDGINDAPALAKAQIGFAMAGGGADTAIETADVALMDDDLRKIPRFIRLSRSTYAILVQNITLALGVKALFFALTFTGNATMWMAVFADVGTALLVVANGLRAMRK
nr:heavy metal translocating P-type ATPase [Desulfovibrio sp. ZJ200]